MLAKAPRPGLAKTRLARGGGLSLEQAAGFARAFLVDTLATCARAGAERVVVAYSPAEARSEFEALAPLVELRPQVEGDLGARIGAAFEEGFAGGAARVVAIGSDTPHLGVDRVSAAFERLQRAEVVLGPTRDGGYYLVGLRGPRPELFEGVEWSTERVRSQTLAAARRLRLRVELLDELEDIDGAAELERLRLELSAAPSRCPATSAQFAGLAGQSGRTTGPK